MSTDANTVAREIEAVHAALLEVEGIAPVYLKTLEEATTFIKWRGLPDSDSYGVHHIEADNFEDAKLKLALATYKGFKRYIDGKSSITEAKACMELLATEFGITIIKRMNAGGDMSAPFSILVKDPSHPAEAEDLVEMYAASIEEFLSPLAADGAENIVNVLERALQVLSERDVPPDYENYDAEHIYAVDMEDLELKMALVVARYFKASGLGNFAPEYALAFWRPIANAVIDMQEDGLLGDNDFPITIKA